MVSIIKSRALSFVYNKLNYEHQFVVISYVNFETAPRKNFKATENFIATESGGWGLRSVFCTI